MPPVERAVVQLTKLVANLAKSKQNKGGLEGILERLETSGAAESSSGTQTSSRSKAAAYKKLTETLVKNPEWIWANIEGPMEEDFNLAKTGPGMSAAPVNSRSWLEHRSKLPHYPSSIRAAWIISGIHDALRKGKQEEARARAALALLAYDQASLDAGSWQLAQELVLEPPPPFTSFQGRKAPDPSEQAWSKLADERILELALWRLKDRDSFIESRKRLGQALRANKPAHTAEGGTGGGSTKPSPLRAAGRAHRRKSRIRARR